MVSIQGSDYFMSKVQKKLDQREDWLVVGIVPEVQRTRNAGSLLERSWPEVNMLHVNHQQTGGVTRRCWKVYSSFKLSGLKSSPIKQALQHILVSTKTGMELKVGDQTKQLIHPDQRLPSQKQNFWAAAPCYFVKNKSLVERDISDKEIMTAYDIEESTQHALSNYSKHTGRELT